MTLFPTTTNDALVWIAENIEAVTEAGYAAGKLSEVLFSRFTASHAQTVFTGPDLSGRPLQVPGATAQVYVNLKRMVQGSQYVIEEAGTRLRFLGPLVAGAEVLVSNFAFAADGSIYFDARHSPEALIALTDEVDAAVDGLALTLSESQDTLTGLVQTAESAVLAAQNAAETAAADAAVALAPAAADAIRAQVATDADRAEAAATTASAVASGRVYTLTDTAGTGAAYTASGPVPADAVDSLVMFTPHVTNTVASPTLAVNGGTVRPLGESGSDTLGVGRLIAGYPYLLRRVSTGAFRLVTDKWLKDQVTSGRAGSLIPLTITGTGNALIGTPPPGFTPVAGDTGIFTVGSINTAASPTITIGSTTWTLQDQAGKAVQPYQLRGASVVLIRFMFSSNARIVGLGEDQAALPSGVDLGTFYTPGRFVLASTPVTDAPSGSAALAFIEVAHWGSYVTQTWRVFGDPASGWTRQILTTSGAKTAWTPLKPAAAVSKFAGKTVVSIGDSISEGTGSDPDGAGYTVKLAEFLGTTVVRGGIGGTCLSDFGGPNYSPFSAVKMAGAIASGDWTTMQTAAQTVFTNLGDDNRPQVNALAAQDWSQELFVLIAFGTNDYTSTVTALGTPGEVSTTTIRGAVNHIVQTILTDRPQLRLGFITPIWRGNFAGSSIDSDTYANAQGFTLAQIAAAIREEAERNHIPVLDNYTRSGLNRFLATSHYSDRTHPNNAGYLVMARSISGWAQAELS